MDSVDKLIVACRKGNALAQKQLFELLKAKLFGICRRYCREYDEAKDILQESFIKIFERLNQLESPEKLEGWARSITIRTAISHYHRDKRRELIFTRFCSATEEIFSFDYVFTDQLLLSLVNSLPDGCRMVFNLHEIEGYSHAEIATMLSCSVSTSRSQLFYAKYLIKKKLNSQSLAKYNEKFA